jgi:DNA-directed DNA polymerase III PolC
MINLKISTEYDFGSTYGRIEAIIRECDQKHLAITDNNTFGHVKFYNACKKAGINPILGLKVYVVADSSLQEKQPMDEVILLAKNNDGLQEIYQINTWANEHFYYVPRLDWFNIISSSENIFIIVPSDQMPTSVMIKKNVFVGLNISNSASKNKIISTMAPTGSLVVIGDNHYPTVDDKEAYQLLIKNSEEKSSPMHIINEDIARGLIPNLPEEAIANTYKIAEQCKVELPQSQLPSYETDKTLRQLCIEGAEKRGLNATPEYLRRLDYEINLIERKNYEDYFFIISDLVIFAKNNMLVGPSRGSSAGSLVCYLMFITDIDPIKHGLIFERFIDVNRDDLPDIDIDFQDTKRFMVFDYLREKYGEKNVGIIGTVLTLQSSSAINQVAKALSIPDWEVKELKNAVESRSAGDERAEKTIQDALQTDLGKRVLDKYPAMKYAADLEGHANHFGKHAAGIVLSKLPIDDYCSKTRDGVCQLDKKDAEKINLLKIDALGLRTLSIIQDCLDQVGKDRSWLLSLELEDANAFQILNKKQFAGIFQFEGQALQSLCKQMTVESFNDIVILTSIARPGPLQSGGAKDFIEVRTGRKEVYYMDRLAEEPTKETLGCIVYQEQVMNIMRSIGGLSWPDVSDIRKAMGKSMGDEYLSQYLEKFIAGAIKNNISEKKAKLIWDSVASFAQYAFNKSHAVSYGMISYWSLILKAYYPLEFYCACLRHSSGDEQSVSLLREAVKSGIGYSPFNFGFSEVNWSIKGEKLMGGYMNLKGVGEKKAIGLIEKLKGEKRLTPGQQKLLTDPVTPFDNIFECSDKFQDVYDNPKKHKVVSGKVARIEEIAGQGTFRFIGRITKRIVKESKGKQWLRVDIEDDTGTVMAGVYDKWESLEDGWHLWKGTITADFKFVNILQWRVLDD